MANLSKTVTTARRGIEKRITVTVEYNPKTFLARLVAVKAEEQRYTEVDDVKHYAAISCSIEVTETLLEILPGVEDLVDSIDWETIYQQQNTKEAA